MEKVQVIDAVMGAGKTTWALNKIEYAPAGLLLDKRYIEIIDNRVVWTAPDRCFFVVIPDINRYK